MIAYFDTSAFVKLIVSEPGTARVSATWLAAERRVTSLLLYPEARAAAARALRSGQLRPREGPAAKRMIETLWAALDRVEVTPAIARRAGELAEQLGLRAYDAVHLASLDHVGDADALLVAADEELLAAALTLGYAIVRAGD